MTKPIISKRTEKVLYWQHEAVAFGFDRFRSEWALHILPGYVFTKDGVSTLLHYSKVGALATRKAARDFNMQVYNDLVFWTWVLAEGRDSFQIELGADSPLMVRGLLLNCELAFPEVADSDASSIPHDKEDAYLARLEREVAEEAESELETAEESDAY